MMGTIIRKASLSDVDGIVAIHQLAFKEFFLTSLGEKFLKLYYSTFIESGEGVVYCALQDNKVVGFSACSYISKGFNTKLIKKNFVRFGAEALRLMFSKPKALIRLVKNMNKESNGATIEDNGKYAELYSIAVSPSCQGGGYGRRLLTVTEDDVKQHNNKVSLTTDYYNNDKTIAFYRKLGYEEYYDFITYPERRMWRLIKYLKK